MTQDDFYVSLVNNSEVIKQFIANNNLNTMNNVKITSIKTRHISFTGEIIDEDIVVDKQFFQEYKSNNDDIFKNVVENFDKIKLETYEQPAEIKESQFMIEKKKQETEFKNGLEALKSEPQGETIATKLKNWLRKNKK